MSPNNATNKPATPQRSITPMQVLSSLFRTPTRLRTPKTLEFVSRHHNKRTHSAQTPILFPPSSHSTPPSTPCTNPSLPAVVLQTYSVSTDSIVLTSLPSVPFCCHEDLLTMSRTQLEKVVQALNARLPRRMRIGPDIEDNFWGNDAQNECREGCDSDVGEQDGLSRMSEVEMRRRIEELVGIRTIVGKNRVPKSGLGLYARTGGVPPAPKAVRTRGAAWRPYDKVPWEEMKVDGTDEDLNIMFEDTMIGSSPLASRTKSGRVGWRKDAARLAVLREENEGSESKEDDLNDREGRPPKRQRVSPESVAQNSGEECQMILQGGQSRFIEHMDVSGSPLLVEEDDAAFNSLSEMTVTRTATRDNGVKMSEQSVPGFSQRRSTRIKEIALERASSVDMRKKIDLDAPNLKSSVLRSRTFSSRYSSRANTASEAEGDPNAPRECTTRLPSTTTPSHQKADPLVWSVPRILRSHSQRPSNSSGLTKTKSLLGRSQSDKYPRAADLAFVTINRPRYQFARRKSKRSKAAKGDREHSPSLSVSPAQVTRREAQRGIRINAGNSGDSDEVEKGNQDPKITTRNSCTIASTQGQGNGGDSPTGTTVKEGTTSTTITDAVVIDGPAERISEALGRMVVDSV